MTKLNFEVTVLIVMMISFVINKNKQNQVKNIFIHASL